MDQIPLLLYRSQYGCMECVEHVGIYNIYKMYYYAKGMSFAKYFHAYVFYYVESQ